MIYLKCFMACLFFALPLLSSNFNLCVYTGISAMTSPYNISYHWPEGLILGGGIQYNLTSHLQIESNFNVNRFEQDCNKFYKDLGFYIKPEKISDINPISYYPYGHITSINYEINLKYFTMLENKMIFPYLISGLGYYDVNYAGLFSQDGFSTSVGTGFLINTNNSIVIFFDVRYLFCFHNKTELNMLPVRIGTSIKI